MFYLELHRSLSMGEADHREYSVLNLKSYYNKYMKDSEGGSSNPCPQTEQRQMIKANFLSKGNSHLKKVDEWESSKILQI